PPRSPAPVATSALAASLAASAVSSDFCETRRTTMALGAQLLSEFPIWDKELTAEYELYIAAKLRSNSPELVRRKFQGKHDGQGCLATLAGWSVYGHNAPRAGRRFLARLGFNPKNIKSALVQEWDQNLRDPLFRAELADLFERAARKKQPSR